MKRWISPVVAGLLVGCGNRPLPPLPLRPPAVPYADTLPIPEPSDQRERRVLRALLVHVPIQMAAPFDPGEGEALDLNHDDDVVSSAWWERRVGYRQVATAELALGPTSAAGAPATSGPLVVESLKAEGVTPGFTMKDDKGDRYIVKFDPPDFLHLQSAAGVIGNRLVWGAGYHVPEDYITIFDANRLVVDPDATVEVDDLERPLTMDDVLGVLAKTSSLEGNRYLAIASRFLPGTPKGPFLFAGTRDDDPNDHFDHEHRRELRALQVISAWINNVDVREGNTLDVYVQPGYLRHYVIDLSSSLGSASSHAKALQDEFEHHIDLYKVVARVATLGLFQEKWENDDDRPVDPALGYVRAEDFDPAEWRTGWSNPAFANMTAADAYWAAKIVATFTDEQIRAAVAAGALPGRDIEQALERILRIRRDKVVAYWFAKVSTVEEPAIAGQTQSALQLSFRDLGVEHGIWSAGQTRYDWRFADPGLGRSGSGISRSLPGEAPLVDVGWRGDAGARPPSDGLAVLEISTRRLGASPPPATIFLRWDGQAYQVAGIAHGDPRR